MLPANFALPGLLALIGDSIYSLPTVREPLSESISRGRIRATRMSVMRHISAGATCARANDLLNDEVLARESSVKTPPHADFQLPSTMLFASDLNHTTPLFRTILA